MTEEEKPDSGQDKRSRSGVSRREFIAGTVGGVVVGAVVGAAAGSLGFPKTITQTETSTVTQVSTTTYTPPPVKYDYTADVVVVGAGGAGLPASLAARAAGASVIVVEANFDVGGHAILTGGNVPLGGGTAAQQKYNITDSPDLIFSDLVDWTVVQTNGMPSYRYNDRDLMRTFADTNVEYYGFVLANGVQFDAIPPDASGGTDNGQSAPRENHCVWTQGPTPDNYSPVGANGTAYARPLEASARTNGVQFLLNYHMDSLITDASGRVVGLTASYTPRVLPGSTTPLKSYATQGNINSTQAKVNVQANKGLIIATGGHSSNVEFRRMFDARLTEEYADSGAPYSFQDASGEMAAMKLGAALWGTMCETSETGIHLTAATPIGTYYGGGGGASVGATSSPWLPAAVLFPLVKATGLTLTNTQDIIRVNMAGNRFSDDSGGGFGSGGYNNLPNYVPFSWANAKNQKWAPQLYIDAALGYNGKNGDTYNGGGPIWAIFDSAAVTREKWTIGPPNTDPDCFYQANDLATLAQQISTNQFMKTPMDGGTLQAAVTRYNSFVDSGVDSDFGKTKPAYKISTPPYYAGWETPLVHDTRTGLRINSQSQVIDLSGNVIPGLYAAGESAGGFQEHGLARAGVFGYIAGKNAAAKSS